MQDTDTTHTYRLCAGSNLENAEAILSKALDILRTEFDCITQTHIKKTTAIGMSSCLHFHNVGISIRTKLQPSELKAILNETEKTFGRQKGSSSVALDIDIIVIDGTIVHPDYQQREYVKELVNELEKEKI